MDVFTFISEIVKATAWPVTIVAVLMFFKRPITELLPRLHKFSYKGIELELEAKLQNIREDSKDVKGLPKSDALLVSKKQRSLGEVSPRSLILTSWVDVESAVENYAAERGISTDPNLHHNASHYILKLREAGVIDQSVVNMFTNLRLLRTEVAFVDDTSLNLNLAIAFTDLCSRLISRFSANVSTGMNQNEK